MTLLAREVPLALVNRGLAASSHIAASTTLVIDAATHEKELSPADLRTGKNMPQCRDGRPAYSCCAALVTSHQLSIHSKPGKPIPARTIADACGMCHSLCPEAEAHHSFSLDRRYR